MPNAGSSAACGETALTDRYIVHYKTGRWDYVHNADREKFRLNYVSSKVEEIDFIEYDQKISIKNEPSFAAATGIDNWGVENIRAPAAWQKNLRGSGIIVAVIDTGVDVTHPQLQSQIYYNDGESGGLAHNGVDDDHNGYIDDYSGYNFSSEIPDGNMFDDVGHGTHVSGIIAAAHADTVLHTGYVQGVAPGAKILPVKFLDHDGGTLSAALKGIDYAVARGAKIINASWGGTGCSKALRQKISDVSAQDVLFVVAAGNSGNNLELEPEFPAAFNLPYQITVGAIRSSLLMDSYSNYSRRLVHIFAPGTKIVSTVPGSAYAAYSGTSMATPFVAGAAAILLGINSSYTLGQLRNLLFIGVNHDPSYANSTSGRLDLSTAIDAAGF